MDVHDVANVEVPNRDRVPAPQDCSSEAERCIDIAEVVGSCPASPTNSTHIEELWVPDPLFRGGKSRLEFFNVGDLVKHFPTRVRSQLIEEFICTAGQTGCTSSGRL